MNLIAIGLAFCLYTIIAIGNLRQKDYPMTLVWASYALSQVGFWFYERSKVSE